MQKNKVYKTYTTAELEKLSDSWFDRVVEAIRTNNKEEFNKVVNRVKILQERARCNQGTGDPDHNIDNIWNEEALENFLVQIHDRALRMDW